MALCKNIVFLKKGHSRPLFFIFVFSMQLTVNLGYKFLPMTGFEPWTSGIGSDRITNEAQPLPIKILF